MERAREVIPRSQHQETPVYLGATAGMRLLRAPGSLLAKRKVPMAGLLSTICWANSVRKQGGSA
ncbi:ENTPD1 isoform 6 [Pongo abelii]|uniref:ENTPD1 isoform 6 n=1 Tax=Pongo abelii TaxID=9601 RepID=A0A2J8Y5K5_PONAB|nr:ENTPD1 isoform 6 [Pongo abelii]